MTGWNLPPGVTTAMIDALCEDGPCEVCGHSADQCICPECPVCTSIGDPGCYADHGLRRNAEQVAGMVALEAAQAAETRQEIEMYRALQYHGDMIEMGDYEEGSEAYNRLQASAIGWTSA